MTTLYDLDDLTLKVREHALTLGTLCDMVMGQDTTDRSDEALIRAVGKLVGESTPTAVESASHGESVDVRLTALRSIDDAYLNAVLDWIAGALTRHEAVSESLTAVRLVRHMANLFPLHRENVDGLAMEQRAGRVNE